MKGHPVTSSNAVNQTPSGKGLPDQQAESGAEGNERETTLDDVAREAGVGKSTIYLHWKYKHDPFLTALWRATQQASQVPNSYN